MKPAFCLLLSLFSVAPALAQPWHYTLGEERAAQQAQFCTQLSEVHALVAIFRNKGPRPGYFALKQLYDCTTRIDTFTPLEIVEEVHIETATPPGYVISFVRVVVESGATEYLVTTRDVEQAVEPVRQ